MSGEILNGWNMTAGYTYTHSVDGEKQRSNTAQPLNMLRLSTTYRLPGNWHALTVGGAVNWQSDVYGAANRRSGVAPTAGSSPNRRGSISRPTAWSS